MASVTATLPTGRQALAVYKREATGLARCYAHLPPRAERVSLRSRPTQLTDVRSRADRVVYDYGHGLPRVYVDLLMIEHRRLVALAYYADLDHGFDRSLEQHLSPAPAGRLTAGAQPS